MNDQAANERKLVEAFRTFFDKSISPYVNNNESVLNEWKYFSRLISTDPIDYSQIEFYILLANKSQQSPSPPDFRSSAYHDLKYNPPQTPSQLKAVDELRSSDKKMPNGKSVNSPKKYIRCNFRKNLLACL